MEKLQKSEERIQYEIVEYFRNAFCRKVCNPRCAIMSIPNDGKDMKEQMRKLATGMLPGASDMIVILPNTVVFVEVKTDIGRQSDVQKEFERRVNALGFDYWLVRSLEEFKTKLSSL